jgi:hypothetical protein
MTNTLAYYKHLEITTVKCFITLVPPGNISLTDVCCENSENVFISVPIEAGERTINIILELS